MNIEVGFLLKVLCEGDYREVVRENITADFFYALEMREAFLYIQRHYSKHGEVPSLELFEDEFPDIASDRLPEDSLSALAEKLREKRVYNEVAGLVEKVASDIADDPMGVLETLQASVSSLSAIMSSNNDEDITKARKELWANYMTVKNNYGNVGIPYPWEILNKATLGMHAGNLILIYGRPKSMKTWVLMVLANHLHQEFGLRSLVVSQEMSAAELKTRAVGLFCGLDYKHYREGTLTTQDEKAFYQDLQAWEESPPYIISRLEQRGTPAVAEFEAKIEQHQVAAAFFDGVYLSGDDWKDMVALSRGLKRVAMRRKIPIIGSIQENRQGQTAYSDSFLQDCDVLLHTQKGKEEAENNELLITTPAMREAQLDGFVIHALPARNFTQKYRPEEEEKASNERWEDDGKTGGNGDNAG